MVHLHGILSILCLLIATYGVQARICGRSVEKQCVPRQSCRTGSESGRPVIEFRTLQKGNEGCPTAETCCHTSQIVENPNPNDDEPFHQECGNVNANGMTFTIADLNNLSQEAELPWMVALLDAKDLLYKHGGSLIAPDVVLTSTYATKNLNENQLIVRAGEWDLYTNTEQRKHVDVAVRKIVRHPDFNKDNGANNVALLFLAESLKLTRHINLICLPQPNRNFIWNRCIVSGWGKMNISDNYYMNIMKKIDLQVVDSQSCELKLKVPYSSNFRLHNSLLCAGGEIGKDACEGDGGAPLACPLQSDPKRYEQAGIVNFGYGCGGTIPGVYTDVSKMIGWIKEQIMMNRVNGLGLGGSGGGGKPIAVKPSTFGGQVGEGGDQGGLAVKFPDERPDNRAGNAELYDHPQEGRQKYATGGRGRSGGEGGNVATGGGNYDQGGVPVPYPSKRDQYAPSGPEAPDNRAGNAEFGGVLYDQEGRQKYATGGRGRSGGEGGNVAPGAGNYGQGGVPVPYPAKRDQYAPSGNVATGGGNYGQGGVQVNYPAKRDQYAPSGNVALGGGNYGQGEVQVNYPAAPILYTPSGTVFPQNSVSGTRDQYLIASPETNPAPTMEVFKY
ncbi:CLIP domain-containing serine protease 2 isoform X2 [Drosophila rhopaloa]|uniref:Peptidase S1 domain-containing protein n=1 Tax=Drosophila rhopaloa TaxID=1041015 RepID=A0ABM5JAQ0_DRORH|nr:CLIP domain-containing serine protease 2 isoform X2 [Drosophila rhopaloa]